MSTSGLDRQLAAAAGQADGAIARPLHGLPSAEQLELLRDEAGNLPKNVFQLARKQGRPPGARNKRDQDLANYIVQEFGDPVNALGNVMAMDWQSLRDLWVQAQRSEDKSKPVRIRDVAEFWLKCVQELMDRVHGKAVQRVEVDGKVDGFIFAPQLLPKGAVSDASLMEFMGRMQGVVRAEDIQLLEAEIIDGKAALAGQPASLAGGLRP